MNYTLSQIALITGGKLIGDDSTISQVFTDSRLTLNLHIKHSLFVAISSSRQSGGDYIVELYNKGFRNFIVEKVPENLKGIRVVQVTDSLLALQSIAAYHRNQYRMPLIAITGSNGKTIVKEWLYQLLHTSYQVVRSPGSYNSQLGVPLSLLQIEPTHSLAIIEAGISKPNEMLKLQQMIKPDMVILTHIGSAHDEGFESKEQKIKEKLKLAENADCLVYNKDDEQVNKLVNEFIASHFIKTYSWSFNKDATIKVYKITKNADQTEIQFLYKSTLLKFCIPFIDDASIENAITCLCSLIAIERLDLEILELFNKLTPVSGRLEQKKAINNSLLINDSYSNDFHSLQTALNFMDRQNPLLSKTVILSDMLESGQSKSDLYQHISELLSKHKVQKLIGIGQEISECQGCFANIPQSSFYNTLEAYIENFNSRNINNEIILLKGARRFQFEKIISLIEKQVHQTKLEISLDAITHNLNIYKEQLSKNTKLMVMVKAFSYGSGSFELAKLLQHHRVDYLAVAYEDEGIMLRNAGITLPIMVMNASMSSFNLLVDYDLEPAVYSLQMLADMRQRIQYSGKKINIHLEFETGMNRLGISKDELPQIIEIIQNQTTIEIKSAFTHMASADDENDDEFTKAQLKSFKTIYEQLCATLQKNILSHAANSAGISRFNGYNLNMARLGIGLHGIDTSGYNQLNLKPVSKLKSVITQVKRIQKGDSIGYNRKTIAEKDFNIAIVSIGYADGLNRLLSNRKGCLYINGIACDIVGNICMDMCMIDVGDLQVSVGQEVVVFENALQLKQMADQCQTIVYEILTGISERITRVYIQE